MLAGRGREKQNWRGVVWIRIQFAPGSGSGLGMQIRIQLRKHWCQKPKFTMISEITCIWLSILNYIVILLAVVGQVHGFALWLLPGSSSAKKESGSATLGFV
jgi:hypothetical protein